MFLAQQESAWQAENERVRSEARQRYEVLQDLQSASREAEERAMSEFLVAGPFCW